MADIRWEFMLAVLLGGGFLGGLLGALLSGLMRRRRGGTRPGGPKTATAPIGIKTTANPILPPIKRTGASDTNAALKYKDITFLASSLFLVEFQLVNLGTRNFREFRLSIALPANHNAIATDCKTPDRDHAVEENPSVTPEAWSKQMDFTLRPFNMSDSYVLNLYIHVGGKIGGIGQIAPTTQEPAHFVDIPALSAKLEEAIRLLGPIPFE